MEARDDHALLNAAILQRDRAAFAEVFERHRDTLYNFAFRILQDSELAQDVTTKSLNIRRGRRRMAKREEHAAMERPGSTAPDIQIRP